MTNPRAMNLADTFQSQIPKIQHDVQVAKIQSGVLIHPPQNITAFQIAGVDAYNAGSSDLQLTDATLALGAPNGLSAANPFTTESGSGPGNMSAARRTIPLRQKHWQAMVNGALVLNYRDAMVAGLTIPDFNGTLAEIQANQSGQRKQNTHLAQALFLDYGEDSAANARQIMNCIFGLPMGSNGGLEGDVDGAGPNVGTSAVLRILTDPGSIANGIATPEASADLSGVVTNLRTRIGNVRAACGNCSRMTLDGKMQNVASNTVPQTVDDQAANLPVSQAQRLPSTAKLIAAGANTDVAGDNNTVRQTANTFSARVIFGNIDMFNTVAGGPGPVVDPTNPSTQGTNVIWDCGNVYANGCRNIVSVGGERGFDDAGTPANGCALGFPMGQHDGPAGGAGANAAINYFAGAGAQTVTQSSHPLAAGEVVIVATCVDNTPGAEKVQFTLVDAVECAGDNSPVLNYQYN
ncbi:MAG: hypothetical protein K0U28_08115 [Cyanobacteria bacterium]|nr:hypothetical protein [Cyanobacteriota bacterium]